jgi:hypothetical protein
MMHSSHDASPAGAERASRGGRWARLSVSVIAQVLLIVALLILIGVMWLPAIVSD